MSYPHVNSMMHVQPPPVYRNQRNFISPNPQQQPIIRNHNSINNGVRMVPQQPVQPNYQVKTKAKFQQMTEDLAKLKRQLNDIVGNDLSNINKSTQSLKTNQLPARSDRNNYDAATRIMSEEKKRFTAIPNFVQAEKQKVDTSINNKEEIINSQEKKKIAHLVNPNKKQPKVINISEQIKQKIKENEELKKSLKEKEELNVVLQRENEKIKEQLLAFSESTSKLENNDKLLEQVIVFKETIKKLESKNENLKEQILLFKDGSSKAENRNEKLKEQVNFFKEKTNKFGILNDKLKEQLLFLKEKSKKLQITNEKLKEQITVARDNAIEIKEADMQISIQQNERLRNKIFQLESQLYEQKKDSRRSFDHVLKDQIQELNSYKEKIQKKEEEIFSLNELIRANRRQTEEAVNETTVERLKRVSQLKQSEQKHQIVLLNKQNEIKTLKHALQTLELKLETAIKQIKEKDEFLKQHLVGRLKTGEEQQYVRNMLKKYEITFPTNNLADKLLEEERIIEDLKKKLNQ